MLIFAESSHALLSEVVGSFARVDRFTLASALYQAFDILVIIVRFCYASSFF